MSIAIVKKEEMAPQYDANGFSRMEMLPGTFPGAHNYKCFLKAGHDVQPEKYADKTAVYCFTAGKGYVTTDKFARNITDWLFLCRILTTAILPFTPSRIWNSCAWCWI